MRLDRAGFLYRALKWVEEGEKVHLDLGSASVSCLFIHTMGVTKKESSSYAGGGAVLKGEGLLWLLISAPCFSLPT